MKRVDRVILGKIKRYCDITEYTIAFFGEDFQLFRENVIFQNAITTCIAQIGELVNRLSVELRQKYSNVPWRTIVGMRNVLVHDYEALDFVSTWETITINVPGLREEIEKIFINESAEGDSENLGK